MDMSGMSMSTSTAMASTTTSMGGMAGMTSSAPMTSATSSMDMDTDVGMGACKISMMWNWNTIDACFISSSWRITSKGMFAGSCIGVILLVMTLELLRRLAREHDRMILSHHLRNITTDIPEDCPCPTTPSTSKATSTTIASPLQTTRKSRTFKPTLPQQMVRALLHCAQFAVAYFIMLLAMYYNGYIIISIFIGAYLGFFFFGWEKIELNGDKSHDEATMCCG
ncbi:Ctr-domain-containing protein [Aureobasidium subglaciale]|nr:Ctr-domain-containing protein [Aureobasidium subglaciale]